MINLSKTSHKILYALIERYGQADLDNIWAQLEMGYTISDITEYQLIEIEMIIDKVDEGECKYETLRQEMGIQG